MTPFRSHGKGTYVLKGTFAGVRVERASGTHDPRRLEDLHAMCRTLADAGRLDVLEDLRDGRVRLLGVWRHYRGGDWSRIPTAEHAKPLQETFEAWRETVPGERHRSDLALALKQLLAHVRPSATVADLVPAVSSFRVRCARLGVGRQFNKVRDAASAFVKATLTRKHPLYQAIRAIDGLPVTRRFPKHPQTPGEARVIAETLGCPAGSVWWILCCTGMGPKEFWTDGWAIEDGHLHVHGQKRAGRDRLVPLIVEVEQTNLTRAAFELRLKRSGLGVTPYDARRSFANWMDQAGILEVNQQAYLGHGPKTITDLYRWHDVVRFLDEDAEKLVGFLVGSLGQGPSQTLMTRAGIEPATYGLKVRCSTN